MKKLKDFDYGDLFTLEEFKKMCESNYVTNDDGLGYAVDDWQVYDEEYVDCELLNVPTGTTHVLWFNK